MIPDDLSETQQKAIRSLAADYVTTPFSLEQIGGGRNSRIYRLAGTTGVAYAIKIYFRQEGDPRDRLGTEFKSLKFLWDNGLRNIPQPIQICREAEIALYEFVEGDKISPASIGESEIDAAIDFALSLQNLRVYPEARKLNPASEAFFSVEAIYQNIQQRLTRLIEGQKEQGREPALEQFLEQDLLPSMKQIAQQSQALTDWKAELPEEHRILSPSDFGFHNAIRRDRLVFVDFEYFGWDDPAKLISDFMLHPAMQLSDALARRFAEAVIGHLTRHFDMPLRTRVKAVYPLFGLKWCLICLNEFLPEHRMRRQFAAGSVRNWEHIRAEQLSKAKQILSRINCNEQFSY